ncbi:hypothetical protein HUT03_02300 [Candidatus Liberibacter africanus]|uniref:hypothetical protein n=1 Tax=Liberibacter africanus TaxID=34020 RepID=UPI00130E9B8B|nr:hypothetical protein [Candidatus Liberibacter africanus]QTP63570.1 hypothetical protein HUT03_00105 [Candidatus Liberibacter africanus]QTP63910.1 hypothetical protein HUT03_02300 [Candidatus Liberibacter africanus]
MLLLSFSSTICSSASTTEIETEIERSAWWRVTDKITSKMGEIHYYVQEVMSK